MSEFNISSYRHLLQNFLEVGYIFKGFDDYDPGLPHLLLRHDLDYDPCLALPLAEVEKELGISSIYYVLIRSDFYNVLEPGILQNLRTLSDMGNRIGLHFDASLYQDELSSLNSACVNECDLLESILGQQVEDISFHRPAQKLLGYAEPIGGRRHSYQPRFFTDIGYCSDSQGKFRYGHPMDHEAIKARKALQLVLHPIWWYAESSEAPIDRLSNFLEAQDFKQRKAMSENSLVYKEVFERSSK